MTYSGELVMPTRYVEVAEDEMMYLDGGFVLNKKQCQNLYTLCSRGAVIASIVTVISSYGGQALVSCISGLIGICLQLLAPIFAKGAKAKGLNITWSGYSVRR